MNEKLYRAISDIDVVAEMEAKHGMPINSGSPQEIVLELLSMSASQARFKEALLKEAGDTTFGMDAEPYLEIVKDLGFIEVYKAEFPHLFPTFPDTSKGDEAKDYTESHYVLANPEIGAVLNFDTYSYRREEGELVVHRNAAQVQYCWRPNNLHNYPRHVLSSGGWESTVDPRWRDRNDGFSTTPDLFYFGYHDAREALRYTLKNLNEHGTFLPVWPKMRRPYWRPFINWADWKTYSFETMGAAYSKEIDRVNRERYATTPDWFKTMTGHNLGSTDE
jgi:hypothetical protein